MKRFLQMAWGLVGIAAVVYTIASIVTLIQQRQRTNMYVHNISVGHEYGWCMLAYEQDHGGRLPDADKWEDELAPYNKNHVDALLHTPTGVRAHRLAMNKYLSGANTQELTLNPQTSDLILLYEKATTAKNACGNPNEALGVAQPPAITCLDNRVGYGVNGCGNHSDFQFSSDPKAMGLAH